MNEDHYILLVQKKLTGDISPQEQSQLDSWLAANTDNERVAKSIQKAWSFSEGFLQEIDLDMEADFQKIENKLGAVEKPEAKVRPMLHRRWLLRVAAAFLLLAVGPYVLKKYLTPAVKYQVVSTDDKASKDPIVLLDGSKVWLNAHSEFTYFTTAVSNERRVKINGEAFFEVAKDATKPFVVELPGGEVSVLGTSFSAGQNDAAIEVVVVSGKVKLSPKDADESLILTANERGFYVPEQMELYKEPVPNLNGVSWHTKKLIFDNTSLQSTLLDVLQFYGIRIQLENKALENCPISATFENKPIETVLETLATILGAEIGQTPTGDYILKGGICP